MGQINQMTAIVVGAGIGGLASAHALAQMFGKVILIDRDRLPEEAKPRIGAPQSRQVHVLLAGGLRALNKVVPGFEEALVTAGAHRAHVGSEICVQSPGLPVLPRRPFEFYSMCMTRPLLEWVLRREVLAHDRIELIQGLTVTNFVTSDDGARVVGVRGLTRDNQEQTLQADFCVDAATRSDLSLKLLDQLNLPRPRETEIGIDLNYSTAIFDLPTGVTGDWKAIIHRPSPSNGRAGFLFPIEDGKWHCNLNSVHGDGAGNTEAEFLDFARTLRNPAIYNALKQGKMVGPVNKFILNASSRRHYEELEAFPEGLIVIGDAICRYNPAYGQGMSVAAQEVEAMLELLQSRMSLSAPLQGLALPYFQRMAQILGAPWSVAEADFIYPQTRGERSPDVQARMMMNRNLMRLAYDDPAMHRLWAEVTNLLQPASVLMQPPYAEILREDPPAFAPEVAALID